ncbi:hypothetical protein PPTG_01799 [Phytophthora nicotianae INRA-310]|uniref:Reverse transcriptase/retrotransposon-derived protein RNase H-like domain-containing protein n=1 Tax=Phytophthora nicotianae (strain INRA-310) TaxID=761204 RepID=W2R8E1_PHYN3|nr:hypothetical protein PPTG_01799 [Phytophthora nicotianae INRA-310]ETN21667.1 hypothetical protein PPTG_01799 [Phytophthora nicotianae INRA-310]
MRAGLVDYARVSRPLQERLDETLSGTKKTNQLAAGVQIDLNPDEQAAFEAVKDLLGNSAMLMYPDPPKQLVLLSDRGWGLVVSQVTDWRPDVPMHEQKHEFLVCMGGRFTV